MALAISQVKNDLHTCSNHSLHDQETLKFNEAILVYQGHIATENPQIPVPALFEFGPTPRSQLRGPRIPSMAECAVHLELLQVFCSLRNRVLESTGLDELLEIKANTRTVYRSTTISYYKTTREAVQIRDETFDERRKVKWPFYLSLAASRFLHWVDAVEDGADFAQIMPPIDVLMVWHSLLLNPSWLHDFPHRKLENLSKLAFPWQAIHKAIKSTEADWPFQLSPEDNLSFEESTHMYSDLLQTLEKSSNPQKLVNILRKYHANIINSEKLKSKSYTGVGMHVEKGELNPLQFYFFQCLNELSKPVIPKLVAAVERQSSFVAKMDKQLWIRSPAIEGTLTRAITRYGNFLKLFKFYPRTMLVPTLDIDLIWHTHQCSPAQYTAATKAISGRFIDHDDKIRSGTLETAMQKTIDLYQIRFGEEYDYCLCWDCETLRLAIHTHNRDNPTSDGDNALEIAQQVHQYLAYYRAIEIARRNKKSLVPVPAARNITQ